jgi:hypothetical protein
VDPIPVGPDAVMLFDNASTADDQGNFRLRFSLKNLSEWHPLDNPVIQVTGPGLETIWCGDLACGGIIQANEKTVQSYDIASIFFEPTCQNGTCTLTYNGGWIEASTGLFHRQLGYLGHLGAPYTVAPPLSTILWFDIGFTIDPVMYDPSSQYTITVTADGFDVNPSNNTVTFTIPGT